MTRIEAIPVEANDTTLSAFAAALEASVNAACARLEQAGCTILGVGAFPMGTSEDVSDTARPHWITEAGAIGVISYREQG